MPDDLKRAISASRKSAAAKSSKRGTGYKPATVGGGKGAIERARARELKAQYRDIDVQLRKEANRHKFSTRAEIEKRARADQQAGKIGRGQLTKTIERRWKAAQGRRAKFEKKQQDTKRTLRGNVRANVKKMGGQALGVGNITALVTFRISNDVRVVTLTFPGSADGLRADAREALEEYVTSDHADLVSVVEL